MKIEKPILISLLKIILSGFRKLENLKKTYIKEINLMSENGYELPGLKISDKFDKDKSLSRVNEAFSNIKIELDLKNSLENADLVIESMSENIEAKKDVYTKINKLLSKKNKRILMLISSITIHNIPEGLAVGVAFGSLRYNLHGASLISAIILAFGIGLQNFPEGTAVSLPLKRDGMSSKKAFLIGSLTGIVEPIASVIGALLVLKVRTILPFLLAFAAGAMIYVVVEELIPESQTNKSKDLMAIFTILGFAVMMFLDVFFG